MKKGRRLAAERAQGSEGKAQGLKMVDEGGCGVAAERWAEERRWGEHRERGRVSLIKWTMMMSDELIARC